MMMTYGGVGDMREFSNNVAINRGESTRMPNQSSSGSSRRSGVEGSNNFFGDQVVCPTCRGVGHIPQGMILVSVL